MNIQEAIKKLRHEMLLEQKEFGDLIGVTKSSVSHYETGYRKPRLPVLRKIIELAKKKKIKIDVEDFFQ